MVSVAPVSTLYVSLFALLLLALSYRVVRLRQTLAVGLGSGGHDELDRAIRVQANFVEYVPIILLMILLAELNAMSPWLLHLAGGGLFVARVLHAWGLAGKAGRSFGRYYGILITWIVLLAMAVTNLLLLFLH